MLGSLQVDTSFFFRADGLLEVAAGFLGERLDEVPERVGVFVELLEVLGRDPQDADVLGDGSRRSQVDAGLDDVSMSEHAIFGHDCERTVDRGRLFLLQRDVVFGLLVGGGFEGPVELGEMRVPRPGRP